MCLTSAYAIMITESKSAFKNLSQQEVIYMPTIILVPLIMLITIGSVVGICALYKVLNKNSGGSVGGKTFDVEGFTKNVEDFTKKL